MIKQDQTSPKDRDLEMCAALLCERARPYFYGNGQPREVKVLAFKFTPVTAYVPFVEGKEIDVAEFLLRQGIRETIEYQFDTDARSKSATLLGRTKDKKVCRIRIPQNSSKAQTRVKSPLVLQPFEGKTIPYRGGNIEILPMIPTGGDLINTETDNLLIESFGVIGVRNILEAQRFVAKAFGLKQKADAFPEVGLLPDGTPLYTKPSQLTFVKNPLTHKKTIHGQQRIIEQYPSLERIKWMPNPHSLKQDHFYGDDYLSSPPKRGQCTKIITPDGKTL